MSVNQGSDLHIWRGDTPLRPGNHLIGYEMVRRVAELGGNIETDSQGKPLAVGDRVTCASRQHSWLSTHDGLLRL